MLRFLTFLLNKPYETCKSCETLKIQLELANSERKELLETIMGLVKPEVVQVHTTITTPVMNKAMPWDKRRKILENEDRVKASIHQRIIKEEKELGIKELNIIDELNETLKEKGNATERN